MTVLTAHPAIRAETHIEPSGSSTELAEFSTELVDLERRVFDDSPHVVRISAVARHPADPRRGQDQRGGVGRLGNPLHP